ncbi:hypothetical protein [Lysobacter sp. Root690]|uniref:hypothetical protein n=1 Tax=Lysobacter sp. Root690 TaxID=1736588 RepID=UPI000AC4CB45|nr:hypothetical protein [Lysobacter sp. Root690]
MKSDKEPTTENEIANWLSKSGLPLEIKAHRAFRDAGLHALHSQRYVDPESGVVRETDVVAWALDETSEHILSGITALFVIECKASPTSWVVINTDDVGVYRRKKLDLGICGDGVGTIEGGLDFKIDSISAVDHVTPYGSILKQTHQPKNDRETAYAALMSVMKAAYSFAHRREHVGNFVFSMPVLVVEAPLYIAKARHDGSFDVESCDVANLRCEVYAPDRIESLVRIATLAGVNKLARHCYQQAQAIHEGVRTLVAAKAASVSPRDVPARSNIP